MAPEIMEANMKLVADFMNKVGNELEMQRRALVAIKIQRSVDRKRRLMLINKLKKQRQNMNIFVVKVAICSSVLSIILSHFIK
jgi:hypothetical protein